MRRVFPQLFQVLPNFHKCFYNLIGTQTTCFLFLFRKYRDKEKQLVYFDHQNVNLFVRAIFTSTLHNNISQHCWRNMLHAFDHPVATCETCCRLKFEPTTSNMLQHVATGWPKHATCCNLYTWLVPQTVFLIPKLHRVIVSQHTFVDIEQELSDTKHHGIPNVQE